MVTAIILEITVCTQRLTPKSVVQLVCISRDSIHAYGQLTGKQSIIMQRYQSVAKANSEVTSELHQRRI